MQINNGTYFSGDTSIPFFSEIGQLAGIQATDWSWSVLLADFDNDGWKDMHITNGIGRDFINADWLEFSNKVFTSTQGKEEQQKAIRKRLADLKPVDLPNYLYINQRDYTFADVSKDAGINELSLSNGPPMPTLTMMGPFLSEYITRKLLHFLIHNAPIKIKKTFVTFAWRDSSKPRRGLEQTIGMYGKAQISNRTLYGVLSHP